MSILEADFQLCANQLNHMSQNIDMHMRDVTSGLSTISHDIQDVASELSSVAYGISEVNARLDMMLNEFIEFRTESFIQNEVRNNHLQEIEMTLKNPNKTEALELFHTGIELIQRRQVRLSLDYLLKAKQLNPLHYRTYIYLAAAYSLLKEHDNALQYAVDSLNHAPIDSDFNYKSTSYQLIGKIYYHKEQYVEAYNSLNKALHIHQNSSLYYDMARYASLIKRTQEAEDYLEKAIKENRIFFNLALVDTAFASLEENRKVLLERIKVEAQQTLMNYTASISKIKLPTNNEVQQILQTSNPLEDGLIDFKIFMSKMTSLSPEDFIEGPYRFYNMNLGRAIDETKDSINNYNQTMKSIFELLSSEEKELVKQTSMLPNYFDGTYENIQNGLDKAAMFKEHLLTFPNRLEKIVQVYRTYLINIFNDAQGSRNSWVGANEKTNESYSKNLNKVDNELKILKNEFIKLKRIPFFSARKKEKEEALRSKEMQVLTYVSNSRSTRHYKYGYSFCTTRIPTLIELYKTRTNLN
ncbi:hypothetical protein ABHN09_16545 [Bacillus paramobilis]|uniref:tetratricopeptide repeat protein n=1 Tax=Bacillus paramobilis TaxID=2817477 RepID=UPI003D1FECF9